MELLPTTVVLLAVLTSALLAPLPVGAILLYMATFPGANFVANTLRCLRVSNSRWAEKALPRLMQSPHEGEPPMICKSSIPWEDTLRFYAQRTPCYMLGMATAVIRFMGKALQGDVGPRPISDSVFQSQFTHTLLAR